MQFFYDDLLDEKVLISIVGLMKLVKTFVRNRQMFLSSIQYEFDISVIFYVVSKLFLTNVRRYRKILPQNRRFIPFPGLATE